MLKTWDTTRVPGFNSRTSFGLQALVEALQEIQRHDGRLADVGGEKILGHESHAVRHARRGGILGRLLDERRIDFDADAAAPYFFAAVMTIRPSPDPRSYTMSRWLDRRRASASRPRPLAASGRRSRPGRRRLRRRGRHGGLAHATSPRPAARARPVSVRHHPGADPIKPRAASL